MGERCPAGGRGRWYRLPPGVELRLDGKALLAAVRSELEQLRGSAGGQIFPASVPTAAGGAKYRARARAGLARARYYLGVPWDRLESFQALGGVPVPEATQWEQVELVGDCAHPIFKYWERRAAQGESILPEDTPGRSLPLMEENRAAAAQAKAPGATVARTGMQTTALIVQVGERRLCLSDTGRQQAGEKLEALLTHREPPRGKPLVMSAALSSNHAEETPLIRWHWLAPGRRKGSEGAEVFPAESAVVVDALKSVDEHDAAARDPQLRAQEWLA